MTLRVRGGGVDELVATVEELDEILDDIEQGANSPVLVSLRGSGGVLHVGLGAGESSVALFLDADHQPLAAHGASVQSRRLADVRQWRPDVRLRAIGHHRIDGCATSRTRVPRIGRTSDDLGLALGTCALTSTVGGSGRVSGNREREKEGFSTRVLR